MASKVTVKVEVTENIEDKTSSNNYIEVVNKRLRGLRKRLTKIKNYESIKESKESSQLNEDQIKAIEKKPEVEGLIKEFEDIVKLFSQFDAEEQKAAKKSKKILAINEQKAAQAAVLQTKEALAAQLKEVAKVFAVFQQINIVPNMLSAHDLMTFNAFYQQIVPIESIMNGNPFNDVLEASFNHLNKFLSRSEESFNGVTYSHIHKIIEDIENYNSRVVESVVEAPVEAPAAVSTSEEAIPDEVSKIETTEEPAVAEEDAQASINKESSEKKGGYRGGRGGYRGGYRKNFRKNFSRDENNKDEMNKGVQENFRPRDENYRPKESNFRKNEFRARGEENSGENGRGGRGGFRRRGNSNYRGAFKGPRNQEIVSVPEITAQE